MEKNLGPFERTRYLLGDQGHSKIMRVFFMEKGQRGVPKVLSFLFREGFSLWFNTMLWGLAIPVMFCGYDQ